MRRQSAACFLMLAFLAVLVAALAGCSHRVLLSADDVITFPGHQAVFAAYLTKDYGSSFHQDIPDTEVRFTINGREVATAVTSADGRAITRAIVDPGVHTFEASARVKGEQVRTGGVIFHWSPNKTAIGVDLDETISATSYIDMFFAETDRSKPLLGANESLWTLSRDYELFYITARPAILQEKTQDWLRKNGFPPGAYVGADVFKACLHQAAYKRKILADLRTRFPNVLIGIGDKKVDDIAYGQNNMLTVIVNPFPIGFFSNRCVMMRDWASVRRFFNDHANRLANPVHLAGIIRENGDRIRPTFAQLPPTPESCPKPVLAGTPTSPPRAKETVAQVPPDGDHWPDNGQLTTDN